MQDTNDPTANTRLIVEAAISHVSELRDSEDHRLREGIAATSLRIFDVMASEQRRITDGMEAERRRIDEHMKAESRRIDEQSILRAEFAAQLALAEAKRIDAIRAVDVNAVSVANERASAQAVVLANQVTTSAETLRALVAATAATVAQQLVQLSSQLTDRIASLEKSQYETKGTASGTKDTTGWILGGLAAVLTIELSLAALLMR